MKSEIVIKRDSQTPKRRRRKVKIAYRVGNLGRMYQAYIEDFLNSSVGRDLKGKVSLIFTSPPFPLNRKKKYGNLNGKEYTNWLASLAAPLSELLKGDGSIVIEMGNAWILGVPAMDTLSLETLLDFKKRGNFYLCEQFVAYNKARLPGPAQWVNVDRIRVKDAFTNIWWMSHSAKPKADNRRVLKEYSDSMKELLRTGKYNAGKRPSEHVIGSDSFSKNNVGAIRSNVLEFSNTAATDKYMRYCKKINITPHPSRMNPSIADFFIRFLTDRNDIVFDPFAGSNTTGFVANQLGRKWISVEPDIEYISGSVGRFNHYSVSRFVTPGLRKTQRVRKK